MASNASSATRPLCVLGVGGTLMTGLAQLAQRLGHDVLGLDGPLYPPTSDQLERANVPVHPALPEGWSSQPDAMAVVGNAISRGHPALEDLMAHHVPLVSGPAWLHEYVLKKRPVCAITGTHGKTTVSSLVTHILHHAGINAGYLIAGQARNVDHFAAWGDDGTPFVLEADEYDTAFFDKRPKFLHYWPTTCLINNVEFDHADVYTDLDALVQQFTYLLRTVQPGGNLVVHDSSTTRRVVHTCPTSLNVHAFDTRDTPPSLTTMSDASPRWLVHPASTEQPGWSSCTITDRGDACGHFTWPRTGEHDAHNALAATLVAHTMGVSIAQACEALTSYQGVARRLEVVATSEHLVVVDDFAHHPTAIRAGLHALQAQFPNHPLHLCVECASFTMRNGHHRATLAKAMEGATTAHVLFDRSVPSWWLTAEHANVHTHTSPERLLSAVREAVDAPSKQPHVVVTMSSRRFGNVLKDLVNLAHQGRKPD